MSERAVIYRGYALPGQLVGDYLSDPIRLLIIAVVTFILGYGARLDNESPFTIMFFEPIIGNAFSAVEIMITAIVGLELMRRLAIDDFAVERSRATRPMLLIGLVVGLYPFLHMIIAEGGLRLPLELLYLPTFVVLFFVFLFLFRREELPVMLWMIIIAGSYKSIEGLAVYLHRGVRWGLLTGWRDGMLLALMLVGAIFAFIIKPGGERGYARMRIWFFAALPVATFAFMGSMRRSFMIGVVFSVIVLVFYLRGTERRAVLLVMVGIVGMSIASLSFIGLSEFGTRISAIAEPTTEGSSAYRLIEIYNVANMVAERPFMGWPLGAQSMNYTGIDFEELSSLIPHNVYLYVMFRGGILGLVVWIGMLVAMMRMHMRTIRSAVTPFERFTSLWLTSATIMIIISGLTTPVITDRLHQFYPFLMVMTSFLPGAWTERERVRALPERA